jgi:hypothetical protein
VTLDLWSRTACAIWSAARTNPPGGVKNHVERYLVVRHLDGAQDFLGVTDVDVARERESQEPHGLLPVHEEYHPGISLLLQLRDLARPHGLEHALTQDRLQGREHEKEPEDISDGHVMLLSSHRLGPSQGAETKEAPVSVVRSMLALRQDQQTSQKHAREEPPTCAHQAIPNPVAGARSSPMHCVTCIRNQIPTKTIAGTSKKNGKERMGTTTMSSEKGISRT